MQVARDAIGNECACVRAGQDATKIFKDYGHSDDAKKIRGKYLIGVLAVRSLARAPRHLITNYS